MISRKSLNRGGLVALRVLVFTVVLLSTAGIGIGASSAIPMAAQPVTTSPSGSDGGAQILGGCRFVVICGTVFNNTSNSVEVCLNWNSSGTDQAYQPADHCASVAFAAPFSVYGSPQLVDIDAIYIPVGNEFWGAYSGIPKEWTHTQSGWWKFGNTTDVHIDLIT